MDLSVVIVNWNTRELLRDCLASLYSTPIALQMEVIVVDNASTDGSAKMVAADFSQVKLIENSANLGYAVANNRGMEACCANNILLLNSDTVVDPSIFAQTVQLLRSDESIGALGCKLLGVDGREEKSYTLQYPRGPEVVANEPRPDGLTECAYVCGAYLLVKREVVERVGMFDEDFFMYCEDLDWCWRMRDAGWITVFDPLHAIVHISHGSSRDVDRVEYRKWVFMAETLLHCKHNPRPDFRYWRIKSLIHHGRCVIGYWLLLRVKPSERTENRLIEHMGIFTGLMALRRVDPYRNTTLSGPTR